MLGVLLLCAGIGLLRPCAGYPSIGKDETTSAVDSAREDAVSRKVLGSSVVTSVSVIMDNGAEKLYADAVGKPQAKPSTSAQVASPINLLNPDRYEFYTFSDSGDLVKRLMTLSEIQGIIANADGEAFNHNSQSPEKKVNDVVHNVQSVLKGEIEKGSSYNVSHNILDTPDVGASWSVILPAIFGNSGEEIKPIKPQASMTPDTLILDNLQHSHQGQTTVAIVKKPEGFTKISTSVAPTTTKKPSKVTTEKENLKKPSTYKPSTYKLPNSTIKPPTTTKKPIKIATTTKRVRTTPTTAIPRITTRGTRPNKRTTTTPPPAQTTGAFGSIYLNSEVPETLERVKHTTTSSISSTNNVAEASSHFIQLFDPVQTLQPISSTIAHKLGTSTKKPIFVRTTPRTPSSTNKISEGALFIVDEKTHTRIPITTKQQLETLLNRLESTTSGDLFKNNPSLGSNHNEPLITLNSLSGHQTPNIAVHINDGAGGDSDSSATTSNIQTTLSTVHTTVPSSTTSTSGYYGDLDIEKYQQLLLTSTNIYEINKELAKSTTSTLRPVPVSEFARPTKPGRPLVTTTSQVTTSATSSLPSEKATDSEILTSTLKEPNLVDSIEQLIQQAVGNIQEVTQTTERITTNPPKTTTTTLPITSTEIPTTTEEVSTLAPSFDNNNNLGGFSSDDLLNEAMGSLLSQVVGSDFQGLTTLQDLPSTTEILNKPDSPENLEYRIKTTDIFSETTETSTPDSDSIGITTELEADQADQRFDIDKATTDSETATSITTTESERLGTTNEILKTDATSYTNNNGDAAPSTATDILQSITESGSSTTEIPESTTEVVKDLPIVFDIGLHGFTGFTEEDKTSTTESVKSTTVKKFEQEATLEKVNDLSETTPKTNLEAKETATDLISTINPNKIDTSENFGDSDSLPSTNNYKEVTSNAALPETTELGSESTSGGMETSESVSEFTLNNKDIATSTLSIDDLIKELKNSNSASQESVLKETTVLIITKPLYSTTPTTSTTTTTTTTTTESPKTTTNHIGNTEAIALDAIASNTEFEVTSKKPEPEWTMVSTIAPASTANVSETKTNQQNETASQLNSSLPESKVPQPARPVELSPMPQLSGLEETTKHLDQDIYQFVALCNELAFGFWKSVTTGISSARSVVLSPFAATSLLAMVFLGARGATSGEMNEILRLDDMVTFNPHLIFRNVSESIQEAKKDGVATSVILRELYSDKSKGQLLNFYKERAKAFYDGHVEEVSFKEIGDVIRRRTNLIVKKQTDGKIPEYIKDSTITVKRPLAGVSASIFQTDCSDASVEGRDGELYFVVLPSIRQRRLVPVPAAVWRSNFLAGYDPSLDATAVALGNKLQTVSTIFVIPGQQGIAAPGDGLARLERSLIGGAFKDKSWSRLLMTLIPRPGLEVQIPRFQHRSVINATVALQQMGMKDLFDAAKADLRGLNGVANDLYLSDILQVNNFATCGEEVIGDAHHSEIYPATANRTYRRSRKFKDTLPPEGAYYDSELSEEPRDYQRAFHDPLHDPSLYALPLPLRPRQARLPDPPRLRFDRPFLYFVRHNPTGLILHMGRFNPRLLP